MFLFRGGRGQVAVGVSFHNFFLFYFQSSGLILAMAWPEVRGGGRPPRDWRSIARGGRDGGSMEGPWGRDGGSTYHRSLHRISTIDSTARHLDGDAGVGVGVDGT